MSIGCRIYTKVNRPEREIVELFRDIPVANIGDNMNRLFCVDSSIKSISGKPLLGTAFTLHVPSGDNLLIHKAFDIAKEGDVLVISTGGMERSYMGEMMMLYSKNLGYAGVVIDGCIRDVNEVSKMDFPVFAKGVNPQGPYKFGPGEINVPIAFGGQVVFPGDIVVGDRDGLIFIRPSEAKELAKLIIAQNKKEEELRQRYLSGDKCPSFNPELREKQLKEINCQIIDDYWQKGE